MSFHMFKTAKQVVRDSREAFSAKNVGQRSAAPRWSGERARWKYRDLKVARVMSGCMGSMYGMVLRALMVETRSYLSRRGRTITSRGHLERNKRSILVTLEMLSRVVYTSNRYYSSTIGMCGARLPSVDTQFRRARIQ